MLRPYPAIESKHNNKIHQSKSLLQNIPKHSKIMVGEIYSKQIQNTSNLIESYIYSKYLRTHLNNPSHMPRERREAVHKATQRFRMTKPFNAQGTVANLPASSLAR
jgi:hypothetical protein